MSIRQVLTLLNLAGVTASGQGGAQDAALLQDLVAELRGTENSGTADLTVKIQDSFDGGSTWNDWITFTQLTATGAEVKAPTRPPGGDVRVDYALSAAGNWDIRVKLSGNPLR